jgi:uncharacterized Rmd1/YagE family protein
MSSDEHYVIAKHLRKNYNTMVNKYMKSRDKYKGKNLESYFVYAFVTIVTWKFEKEETLNFITVIKLFVQI